VQPAVGLLLLALVAPVRGESANGVFKTFPIPSAESGAAAVAIGDYDLWFTEPDANRIGHLDFRDRTIREFEVPTAESGLAGIATSFSQEGVLQVWFTESRANKIGRLRLDGTIDEFDVPTPASEPWGITSSVFDGEVWFTERAGNKVARIAPDGAITEYAVPTPGSGPTGIALNFGSAGSAVAFTESRGNAIGIRSAASGQIRELPIPTPDSDPREITLAADGTLWFTERAGDRIGRISEDVLQEFPLPAGSHPAGITADIFYGSFVWFTEPGTNRIGFATFDGRITEYPIPHDGSEPLGIVAYGNQAWFSAPGRNEVGRVEPDVGVIAGFGPAGLWVSRLDVANREARRLSVFAGYSPYPPTVCPSVGCFGVTSFELPPLGTAAFEAGISFAFPFFSTAFSRPVDSGLLSTLHVGYVNTVRPVQKADAPVVRLSTISGLDLEVLSFPSAAKGPGVKSNLFLSNPGGDGAITGLIEVFLPDGGPLRAEPFEVGPQSMLAVSDVVTRVGRPDVENAQVRVTKTGGEGLLWGSLATVRDAEGTISVAMGSNLAGAGPDSLLIAGAGWIGSWDTDIELANPTSALLEGWIFAPVPPILAPCPPACASTPFSIPANGTFHVRASEFIGELFLGPRTLRIETLSGTLPVAHARVVNRARPTQAADLPVLAESRLRALDPDVLVFPAATRLPAVHGNLFLTNVGSDPSSSMAVLVEAYSPDGLLAGSRSFSVPPEGGFSGFTIPDVLARLGVASLENGQIRVTKVSGGGTLWGLLSTVSDEGWLSVAEGVNP
jgi:virginiamycin B lyase